MADPVLWERLVKMNREEVASRTQARLVGDKNYEINILSSAYLVDVDKRSIEKVNASKNSPSDEHCSVAIVMYLLEGKSIPPIGEWVSPLELPGGAQFFRGPHAVPVNALIQKFGNNKADFIAASQNLGGQAVNFADIAYSFKVFPNLPIAALLWLADDEFPARVSLLVDRTAYLHFPLDAMLGALIILEEELLRYQP